MLEPYQVPSFLPIGIIIVIFFYIIFLSFLCSFFFFFLIIYFFFFLHLILRIHISLPLNVLCFCLDCPLILCRFYFQLQRLPFFFLDLGDDFLGQLQFGFSHFS